MFEKVKREKFKDINQNSQLVIKNTIAAFVVKGGALVISLLTMPAYIKYFNNQEILGIWFTILSILSWVLTFDLGIGNGLRNRLVPAIVNKDNSKIKKYISSAYLVIGLIVILSISFSIIVFKQINWNVLLNISHTVVPKNVLNIVINIVFIGIMLQFLFKLITSILYSMQKSALNNLLSLVSSVIILIYVSSVKSSDVAFNLITLAIVNVLAVNLPLLIVSFIVFRKELKDCRPSIKSFEMAYAKEVLILGGNFFWVQIMFMIITATNEFLIAWMVSPEKVVEYQIYNKLFTLIGSLFSLSLTPIWSAVTKAFSEKNYFWVQKLYKKLKYLALIGILFEFLLIFFLQFGIDLWLDENNIKVNYLYAIVFAVFGSLLIWNGVVSSIANGLGKLRVQMVFFTVGALVKIPIAFVTVGLFNSWIGIIIANIFSLSLYCIVQPIILNKYLKSKISLIL